uniref:Dermatopontin n=1 Tax=Eptatretus burgeri TaxID=7764 RepID=A0A8C4WZJ5_EPTBU
MRNTRTTVHSWVWIGTQATQLTGEARRSPKPEPKPQPSIYVPWLNQYRQRFYHQCPHGEILSSALSFFNQDEGRDRLWSYGCRRPPSWLGPVTECFWEDYNRAGQQWSQRCSGNGIVAGVQSNYFEAVLDREWQFYCCKFRDTCPTSCWMTTDYPSYLTEEMEFYLDHGYYIHGAQSTFGPVKRDRQWKFILCQMSAVACVKP